VDISRFKLRKRRKSSVGPPHSKTKRLLRLITNSSAQKAKRFGPESLLRVGHLWFWIGFLKGGLVFAEERLNPREFRFHGFA